MNNYYIWYWPCNWDKKHCVAIFTHIKLKKNVYDLSMSHNDDLYSLPNAKDKRRSI